LTVSVFKVPVEHSEPTYLDEDEDGHVCLRCVFPHEIIVCGMCSIVDEKIIEGNGDLFLVKLFAHNIDQEVVAYDYKEKAFYKEEKKNPNFNIVKTIDYIPTSYMPFIDQVVEYFSKKALDNEY